MLKKRVIFTLLYDRGAFMLSRNFRLQKVGDLNWLQKNYNFSKIAFSIDELVVLDVSRRDVNKEKFCENVKALTEGCFVPIAAGGQVRDLDGARMLLRSGADKVVVNTLLAKSPDMVNKLGKEFGRQCIIASVDVKMVDGQYKVFTHNGEQEQKANIGEWVERLLELQVGEIYLNSIERDGTGQGYQLELLNALPARMPIPVILAGGAGKGLHFSEGLRDERVDAVATAHLFNFVGDGLIKARAGLLNEGLELAVWDMESEAVLKGCLKN